MNNFRTAFIHYTFDRTHFLCGSSAGVANLGIGRWR